PFVSRIRCPLALNERSTLYCSVGTECMSQSWRFIKLAALAPLLAGLVGCTVASSQDGRSPAPPSSPMATSLAHAEALDDATDYRITSQDILQVAVFQVRDLDRTVRVDGGGFVSLPLIGSVPVRGKTL